MSHFWRLLGGGRNDVISSKTKGQESETTLGNSQEKVALQCTRNASEKVGIQILAFKNFVGIGAVAMQLLRQPHHRSTLQSQFLPNHITNM